jgi:hypothetical protein
MEFNMTLLKIFNSYVNEDILKTIIELYPDQEKNREGYINMMHELRETPCSTEPITMFIEINAVTEEESFGGESYIDVSGRDPGGDDGLKTSWAIEYTDWSIWLAMEVVCVDFDDPRCDTNLKLLAHCLWEMSWAGYTQKEVKEQAEEILERSEEISEAIENGTIDEITTPAESVFEALGAEKPEGVDVLIHNALLEQEPETKYICPTCGEGTYNYVDREVCANCGWEGKA